MQARKGGKEPDEVQDGIHVCPSSVSHSPESDHSSVTTATHTGKEIIYTILPPRIAKVRHPVPVRPLGAGRSRRARSGHQGLIKLRARTSALTLSRPSPALPSVYISKVQCPLQDPVPLIDLPTAFRPKPSIAMIDLPQESTSKACRGGQQFFPNPPHLTHPPHHEPESPTPTQPHNLQGRQPTAFPPTSPTRRPLRPSNASSSEISRVAASSYPIPDTHASVHSSMHHIDSRSTHKPPASPSPAP